MAPQTPELTDGLRGPQRRGDPPLTMEPLEPWTSATIRCGAARDMLGRTRLDQGDRTASGFAELTPGQPGHPRRFHDARGDPTGRHPVGAPRQVTGKGAKLLHRWRGAIGWHPYPRLFGPRIAAGSRGMEDRHRRESGWGLLAFFGHIFLQSEAE